MAICPQCNAAGIDHHEMKQKLKDNLFWFTYHMVSDWVSPDLHLHLGDWFQDNLKAGKQYHLLMIPRGHLKTTMFTIAFTLWLLVNNPELRILIVTSSDKLAHAKLREIQNIALSEGFNHFFGELVPDNRGVRWNASEMELKRVGKWGEPSAMAIGAGTKIVGAHFDVQIVDDLIDGKGDPETQGRNALEFLKASNGLWIKRAEALQMVIGTLWPGLYYQKLLLMEHFQELVLGCYVDDRFDRFMLSRHAQHSLKEGDPIFDRETRESLKIAQESMEDTFVHQMLNKDVDDSIRRFHREDVEQFYILESERGRSICVVDEVSYPVSLMFRQLTIDPAGSVKKHADQSAITVTGWVRGQGVAFVLESWAGKIRVPEMLDKALRMAYYWDVNVIRPEHVAFQVALGDLLRERMKQRKKYITIRPIQPGIKSKGVRILGALETFVANRQLLFNRGDRDQEYLREELINLQVIDGKHVGKSPNLVDSLSFHSEFWRRPPKIASKTQDIDYEDDEGPEEHRELKPKYGLVCPTRKMMRI